MRPCFCLEIADPFSQLQDKNARVYCSARVQPPTYRL